MFLQTVVLAKTSCCTVLTHMHNAHTYLSMHTYIQTHTHAHTHTHTHTHTHMPALQELAEQEGDMDRVSSLSQQLEAIEERAEELDKQRTKGLSAIRLMTSSRAACVSHMEDAFVESETMNKSS